VSTTHSEGFQNVRYDVRDCAAWITIDRPDKLNALDRRTVEEIARAVERAVSDREVFALVLSGAGSKAFVAGADIAEMARMDAATAQAFSRFLQSAFDALERSSKPVIAAVNGFALGGGCELALACHLRLAAENARFGQPEVGLGLIPGAGGTQRLQRLVGRSRALGWLLTGETFSAAEALGAGLVHAVHPPAELEPAVAALLAKLRTRSPIALARVLEATLVGGESSQAEGLALEAGLFGLCFATEDMREGTQAFLDKRKPGFVGR
jgi:enoyl-CoA hydratase